MNLNKLARAVTLMEGKKRSLSIAQVKEVIRCLMLVLAANSDEHLFPRKCLNAWHKSQMDERDKALDAILEAGNQTRKAKRGTHD